MISSSKRRLAPALLGIAGLCGGLLGACNGGDEGGDSCVSTREYFVNEVWPKVMGKTCITCHGPAGVAEEQGAEFRLLPASYPGFLDANLDAVRENASVSYDGLSALLAKPTGKTKHGGGEVIKADSEEYRILESLLAQIKAPRECPDGDGADLDAVELLSPEDTFRKATLHLAGRLPTAEELADVAAGDDALADAVREVLDEDAFYDRLGDIFNDLLLTDRYLAYTGFAVNLLNEEDFPNSGVWWDGLDLPGNEDLRWQINRAAAREPIDLIGHIVRNDRPFTEILTADYTVVNPFSAQLYGLDLGFSDPADPREFKETKLFSMRGGKHNLPHAGVLSSPMFLNRFPTTPTNRNRHRARMTYKLFLATDVLRIGERPIDPSLSEAYTNPTRDDKQCNFCHYLIDPVAGAFQNYDDYDQEVLTDREWYPEMFAPGFDGEDIPKSEFPKALEWLGERLAKDPRFVIATVHTVFRALTGVEPLVFPSDTADPLYASRLKAWEAQDALFRQIGEEFVADDYNLKTAIVGVVRSPYFRGVSIAKAELSEAEAAELAGVGVGRLSTPELLANKIEATTEIRWIRGWDLNDWLATDFRILYGGIDSDTITQRLGSMNGIMSAVAGRMANEVACAVTAYDFSRAADKRKLFPKVTLDHVPLGPTGDEIPDAIADIKANIIYLHQRVLGETLAEDDPEVERTYKLFLDTWKEGAANVAGETEDAWLSWWCQARVDPNTNVDLPEAERINTDENYVIRAWMAVMSYLLSDYRFLYE